LPLEQFAAVNHDRSIEYWRRKYGCYGIAHINRAAPLC
jgi:hypothetical protein